MPEADRSGSLQALLAEALGSFRGVRRRRSAGYGLWALEAECVAKRNYVRSLRSRLDRTQVSEAISEARRIVWPQLNLQPVSVGPPKLFLDNWSSIEVDFRLERIPARGDLSLLGFYLGRRLGLRRPLICVNTAHHQIAVGAAFAHEMAHHVTVKMFDNEGKAHFLSLTGYKRHLDEASEMIADLLVSLGVYPRGLVERLGDSGIADAGSEDDVDPRLFVLLSAFAARYGLVFDKTVAPGDRLFYLVWLLHYTKLRLALFDGYNL